MVHLRPTAINVTPMENFNLLIQFDNGERKIYDVQPHICGNWYGMLGDKDYFKTVQTDGYTVAWQEGQDLCPDDLYYLSTEVGND